MLPFKAKHWYWSYAEYKADQKLVKVMFSSQRKFEPHRAFLGRSRSLLLTLESTFMSLLEFCKTSNFARGSSIITESLRGTKGMREQEISMMGEGAFFAFYEAQLYCEF